jgi:hypothetical protein
MLTNDQIDEIAGPGPDHFDRRVFARAIEAEATAPLLARIAEMEADAKRWKKLKSIAGFGIRKNGVVELTVCFSGHEPGHIGQLDAAIDNAMKEQP